MKHPIDRITLPVSTLLLLAIGLLWAFGQEPQNQAPIVSNARAQQRAGTHLVYITYDVADPDGDVMTVFVQLSSDGGVTFDVPARTFSGDVGAGIRSGTGKQIVWDAGADTPHTLGSNYVAQILADDGVVDTSGKEIISETDGARMRLIPAGEFEMGSSDMLEGMPSVYKSEQPVRSVKITSPFLLARTEVTKSVWARVTGGKPPGGELGIHPVIPSKENEDRDARPVEFDRDAYRDRNIVERLIGWLKEARRVFSRFEKTAKNFAGMIKLAFIQRYLRITSE